MEGSALPPQCGDLYEDWVRAPISRADLDARLTALRARVDEHKVPQLDDRGVLQFGAQSITISATQTELLELFVTQFGKVVAREALRTRLSEANQSSPTRNSLDLHIMRLRRRILPLNLSIRTVWGRGYVLECCGAHTRS
ncbi:winged helix-turn-helix domain-containing protein [Amycolatopsis nigrescens]|uniref:winged helix-turn-helix domain-containing protein n=1 Tax=Amycolatopsis nigrescens TaxID=381445 RepID=UPI00036AAF5B|nr:winged helix-turn-helix domain-containing protein [Amycolatopsis nigrescens]